MKQHSRSELVPVFHPLRLWRNNTLVRFCPAAFGLLYSFIFALYSIYIFFSCNYHLFVFRANMGQILCYFAPFGSLYPIFKQYNRLYINICLRYAPGFVHPLPFGFGSFICYRVIYPPGFFLCPAVLPFGSDLLQRMKQHSCSELLPWSAFIRSRNK